MRVLHTADWHVGKKLGRLDRSGETAAVLDELVAVADDRSVDVVLVAGDLFDRAGPQLESMRLVLETLVRLAGTDRHVVAIPGNHDSAEWFRVLAPLLAGFRVHLVDKPREPADGGIVSVPSRDGSNTLRVACVPFIHEAQVVEILEPPAEGYKSYAERIRDITGYYGDWLLEHPIANGIDTLMGHFMVHGAVPSGSERELHIGEAYMASADAIPSTIKYAALGHIHLPQDAPGSSTPARFAGSLMQLDFGEAAQSKSVCIVDLQPGMKPAQIEIVPISGGRALMKVSDSLDGLGARIDEFGDAWLHVSVKTDGPQPGLADEVRSMLPNALVVVAEYERAEFVLQGREGRALPELYSDYVQMKRGIEPTPELLAAFRSLADAVGAEL
jgi:DNA repair protein SbcD/Mre11